MKNEYLETLSYRWKPTCPTTAVLLALLVFSQTPNLKAAAIAPPLGEAGDFTILGDTTVTNTGLTIIIGNVGVSPGPSITGFPPGVAGSLHVDDAMATQAHADAATAYGDLAGEASTTNLTGQGLGGLTLTPGVYSFATSAQLTGTLTLSTLGNTNAVFVFQIGTTLTTAANSSVIVIGGVEDPNIFWQVGSSATLGSDTAFVGNILALTSVTLTSGADISDGRALAINAAVTMDTNQVSDSLAVPVLGATGPYWKGGFNNLWSNANWSATAARADNTVLPAAGANVVFSVTGVAPQNENTILDYNANIASLTVNDPVPVTIANPVGVPNTLTISGAGATTGITVNSGAGFAHISTNVVLGGTSQTITVNNAAGLLMDGVIGGTVGLTKAGADQLTLTAANNYLGATSLTDGPVIVGTPLFGTLPAYDPLIADHTSTAFSTGPVTLTGGVLATTSTEAFGVGGDGQAILLDLSSSYTQPTGSTGVLVLNVVAPASGGPAGGSPAVGPRGVAYDSVAATGPVAINGGGVFLSFMDVPGAEPSQGQRYELLTSTTGPVAGSLPVTSDVANPYVVITTYNDSFGGAYAPFNLIASIYRPFGSFYGLDPNQSSVAYNIDHFVMGNQGLANTDFFDNIVTSLTASTYTGNLGHSLDELSPQRFEILHNVAFDEYAFAVQGLDDYQADVRDGQYGLDTSHFAVNDSTLGSELSQVKSRLLAWQPTAEPGLLSDVTEPVFGGVEMNNAKDMKEAVAPGPVRNWNGFIDGGADLGDLDDNRDVDDSTYTGYRVRGGADFHVTKDIRVGALFGYEHTDVDLDNEGSRAHVDSYTPGIYAAYADKAGFYANALFTYTRNQYSTDRQIIIPGISRTANGSTGGDQFGGNLDGGYEYRTGGWVFGPSAGLTYVNLGINSFDESGASSVDLAVQNQTTDSLRSRLGGTVRYDGKIGSVTVSPHAAAYWQHEFLDHSNLITSSFEGVPAGSFNISTVHGDKDNALLDAGVDADITNRLTLFVDYGAEAGGATFFGQTATGGVKIGF